MKTFFFFSLAVLFPAGASKDFSYKISNKVDAFQTAKPEKIENQKLKKLESKNQHLQNNSLINSIIQKDSLRNLNSSNYNLKKLRSQQEHTKNQHLQNNSLEKLDSDKIKTNSKKAGFKKEIVIGSKIFTENILLGELLALILEQKYNFKVTRKFNMGGTKLVFDALKSGDIDIYPEYTGTGYAMILKESQKLSPEETYLFVKKEFLTRHQLLWSPPLGFENTYTLTVRKSDSRFKNISSTSELEELSFPLQLAAGHEFTERKDGWRLFSKNYKLNLKKNQILSMNPALMYSAIRNKKVDLIMAYSTDGRIKAYQLKTLKDDKKFFPSYLASYLTRQEFLEKHPEIKEIFKIMENQISEEEMIQLNNEVDQNKKGISQTSHDFLIKKGILKSTEDTKIKKSESQKQESLLSYYYQKKNYLLKIFIEHLVLVFTALMLALLFALPLSIWALYNSKIEKIAFFFVNTLQTIPSMALLGALIPLLGIGFAPAITALFIYSLLPLIRNTFEGLKNIDNSYIEVSAGIGLTKGQILRHIQIPLALPVMIAGIRTAVILLVGTATLAAFIGAGGLGDPIFRGIATLDSRLIFMGAIPACALAVFLDMGLGLLEQVLVSKGLQKKRKINPLLIE